MNGRLIGWWLSACCLALSGISFVAVAAGAGEGTTVVETGGNEDLLLDGLPWLVYIGSNDYPPENVPSGESARANIATLNLDAPRNLEVQLSEGLPTHDREAALRIANERFDALSEDQVQAIFRPLALVMDWDIRKVPAVVFGGGQYVIYGVTDIAQALDVWREWRRVEGVDR